MTKGRSKVGRTINCTFQLTSETKSPYWSVVKYYQTLEKEKARQLLLESAIGYWGALATLRYTKELSVLNKKYCLEEGIYQLGMQIDFLRCQFPAIEQQPGRNLRYLPFREGEAAIFDFRYQTSVNTTEGLLVQFLMDATTLISKEQKVLWSSLSYWGAIADRELEVLPTEELTHSAANCIYWLKRQIVYLEKCLAHLEVEISDGDRKAFVRTGWISPMGWVGELVPHRSNGVVKEVEQENGQVEGAQLMRESKDKDEEEEVNIWTNNPENDDLILKAFNNL
jgi:hypothetical protein